MKWFKKTKSKNSNQDVGPPSFPQQYGTPPVSGELFAKLPAPLLERIFSFVCSHTRDETYESCENSAVEDTCMLCDLRDLAHCAQASRRWRKLAGNVLYVPFLLLPYSPQSVRWGLQADRVCSAGTTAFESTSSTTASAKTSSRRSASRNRV